MRNPLTGASRLATSRPSQPDFAPADTSRAFVWPDAPPARPPLLRQLRAVCRGVGAVGWTLIAVPIQAVMVALPGRGKVKFAHFYWAVFSRVIGISVRVVGTPAPAGRPVVFAANHCSWLDIPVLGGLLDACFISKDAIARWPGVNIVARLGRTVFVSRTRGAVDRERNDMRARLAGGDNLVLFPEGTSSDGSRVLPFRSAFFSIAEDDDGSIAEGDGVSPLVQPISVVYDRLAGLPTGRRTRTRFAWYGDMNLAQHFWQYAQGQGMRVTVLFHPPMEPKAFASRKALSNAAWDAVAGGAAAMRQNRTVPVVVRTKPAPAPAPQPA